MVIKLNFLVQMKSQKKAGIFEFWRLNPALVLLFFGEPFGDPLAPPMEPPIIFKNILESF